MYNFTQQKMGLKMRGEHLKLLEIQLIKKPTEGYLTYRYDCAKFIWVLPVMLDELK